MKFLKNNDTVARLTFSVNSGGGIVLTVTSKATKLLSPSSDKAVAVSVTPVPSVAFSGAMTVIRITVVSFSATKTLSGITLKLKEVTVSLNEDASLSVAVTSIVKLRLAPRL